VGDAAGLHRQKAASDQSAGWIVDGDHDEAIKRENTEFMAKEIPARNCS